MFKSCYEESRCETLVLPGVEKDDLKPIINYLYTGHISINGENVASLLNAASLLILPSLIQGKSDRQKLCALLRYNIELNRIY